MSTASNNRALSSTKSSTGLHKNEKLVKAESESEEWSSDWTWETCSSSDEEGFDFKKEVDGSYSYFSSRLVL